MMFNTVALCFVAIMGSTYGGQIRASDRLLVTGYNSEMAIYRLLQGGLELEETWSVPADITWVEQGAGSLWAIHEVSSYEGAAGGAISRWEMQDGKPVLLQWLSTGVGPAHLLVDLDHNLLVTSNYGAGSISVFSITSNGTLGSLVQTEQYGAGCRDLSHPHQAVRRGDLVWVVDLGCDAIYTYRIVGGRLELAGEKTAVDAGAGPRHMAFHPTQKLAFLACELKPLVNVYIVDEKTGNLTLREQLPFASNQSHAGAEILVSEDGNMVYASSRGLPKGVIVTYRLSGDLMEREEETFLAGSWPRSMAIQGEVLIVGDQKGDSLQYLAINSTTGHLVTGSPDQLTATPPQPAYLVFLAAEANTEQNYS